MDIFTGRKNDVSPDLNEEKNVTKSPESTFWKNNKSPDTNVKENEDSKVSNVKEYELFPDPDTAPLGPKLIPGQFGQHRATTADRAYRALRMTFLK